MSATLIVTIGLTLVIIAIAAGLTARNHSIRPLVMGLGLGAIPLGLYLTGVTDLTINGVLSLIHWFQRTPFTNATAWGIGLAVGGIVLFVIGTFLPKRRKPEVTAQPAAPQVKPAQPSTTSAGKPAVAPPTARPAAASPAQPTAPKPQKQQGLDPEDAEIEALLRKRGIM